MAEAEIVKRPVVRKPVGIPPTVRILLEENDGIPPTGQPFGLNGRFYILRPGMEAEVPPGIIEILDNAVMAVAVRDPMTQKVQGYRDKLRFPYRVIRRKVISDDDE